MADTSYPQLPTTVWRGVHQILKRTPKRKLDDSILAAELGVQQTAAKQYLRQFVILGLLEDDGSPTKLADKWRQDDEQAIGEIMSKAYPEALLDLAPRDSLDRAKIVRWFTGQGLGMGAAGNKAATYMMIAQAASSDDDVAQPAPTVRRRTPPSPSATSKGARARASTSAKDEKSGGNGLKPTDERQKKPDLNVNVQIHISADASVDQIEAIFASMKRYFDDVD